jgi:hypothetical protein
MTIAILCPVHRRPDLVAEQIKNYKKFVEDDLIFVLHPSNEGRPIFEKFQDNFNLDANIIICKESWKTNWRCTMGAYLSCSLELFKLNQNFDYVYIHTDGDLLFRRGASEIIRNKKTGYTKNLLLSNSDWVHAENLRNDVNYKKILDSLDIKDIFFGRQEGSFFTKQLWEKIIDLSLNYFSKNYFENNQILWPLEESIIATLAFFKTKQDPMVSNLIYTKAIEFEGGRENILNCVNVNDLMLRLKANDLYYGIKWFSQDINDSSREYLKSL